MAYDRKLEIFCPDPDNIVIVEREATRERDGHGRRVWKEQRVMFSRAEMRKMLRLIDLRVDLEVAAADLIRSMAGISQAFDDHADCKVCAVCRGRAAIERARSCPALDVVTLVQQGRKANSYMKWKIKKGVTWKTTTRV